MMTNLSNQIATLERARKNYEKAFKEAERALDNYQRADADLALSRMDVEKQRTNMTIKSQQCEDAKNEYANQLQKTNDLQVNYFIKRIELLFFFVPVNDELDLNCFELLLQIPVSFFSNIRHSTISILCQISTNTCKS